MEWALRIPEFFNLALLTQYYGIKYIFHLKCYTLNDQIDFATDPALHQEGAGVESIRSGVRSRV